MRIIISPAKKMNINTDDLAYRDLPEFLPQTEQLLERLRGMSYDELKKLWKCSDKMAEQNYERLHTEFGIKGIQHKCIKIPAERRHVHYMCLWRRGRRQDRRKRDSLQDGEGRDGPKDG